MAQLFGGGPMGGFAARGVTFLGTELKEAVARSDQPVTRVRLQPGETYTVVAYPRANRAQRKLARRQSALLADYQSQIRPTRRQLKKARSLSRAQRKLARTRPSSRRYDSRAQAERTLGIEFDRVMRPSRKQVRTASELNRVSKELNHMRAEQFRAASRINRRRRRVTVYG